MLAVHEDRLAAAVASARIRERVRSSGARARTRSARPPRRAHGDRRARFRYARTHQESRRRSALRQPHALYAVGRHSVELRATIADYASRFRQIAPAYGVENVVVAPGAKPVIWNMLSALLDPGDDFIYFDPAYPAYASCASYLQANVHAIPLLESRNWRMDLDELARRVSHQTKAVVINSPHNPTGGVLTQRRSRAHRRAWRSATISWSSPTRSTAATSISTADYVSIASLTGHARSHDRRRRFFESLRDDRMAAWLCDHAPRVWRRR